MRYDEVTRTQARADVARPGKFEGEHPMVPLLWDVVLNGGSDETAHDDSGYAYDRVGRWVVFADCYGFINGTRFASDEDARAALEQIDNR